jgi:NarL family two-component system response regulator LiaR
MFTFHSIERVLSQSEEQQLATILSAGVEAVLTAQRTGWLQHKPAAQKAGNVNDLLNDRQRQILYLIQKGKTNQQIAEILLVTRKTVKYHIERILDKLEVGNRAQAIAKAIELNIPLEPL